MHRLRGLDYKRPFYYMVTLKRLPGLVVFAQSSQEREARAGFKKGIWYNFGGE